VSLDHVDVVRGKSVVRVPVTELLARAATAARVVVDLGAGDGRFAYRRARAHSEWLCIAVDACAAGMRELSWRALRKPSRGGAPNVVFVRAAIESLPQALAGIADEVTINYPWGSLLRAVLEPDPAALGGIVRLGRPGAALRIHVNESALAALQTTGRPFDIHLPQLRNGYLEAGVRLNMLGRIPNDGESSWGLRLLGGRSGVVLAIDGTRVEWESRVRNV
jgi:16S rRNA (adenine(1408)-N(1))-methyltransferase